MWLLLKSLQGLRVVMRGELIFADVEMFTDCFQESAAAG